MVQVLEVLSDCNVIHSLLQVLGHGHISVRMGQELGAVEVAADLLEEFSHSYIVRCVHKLCDRYVVCSLVQEFGHANIILVVICEELRHRNVIRDLLEEGANAAIQELVELFIIVYWSANLCMTSRVAARIV